MDSSHGEDSALTQIAGAWGRGGEGRAACPIQVNLQGLGLGAVSGGEQLGVGKGFPVCRPWPVPPVAPRQQQERGGGSS